MSDAVAIDDGGGGSGEGGGGDGCDGGGGELGGGGLGGGGGDGGLGGGGGRADSVWLTTFANRAALSAGATADLTMASARKEPWKLFVLGIPALVS
jgi:hypothetical protein